MTELDLIIILTSGFKELEFCEEIILERRTYKNRLLWFEPRRDLLLGSMSDNKGNYKIRTMRENFELNCYYNPKTPDNIEMLEQLKFSTKIWSYFIIHPEPYEEWLANPRLRLSDAPKPENAVLLVDDFVQTRMTFETVTTELNSLGYKTEKIFTYAKSLSDFKYELTDSNYQKLTTPEFLEIIKNM